MNKSVDQHIRPFTAEVAIDLGMNLDQFNIAEELDVEWILFDRWWTGTADTFECLERIKQFPSGKLWFYGRYPEHGGRVAMTTSKHVFETVSKKRVGNVEPRNVKCKHCGHEKVDEILYGTMGI